MFIAKKIGERSQTYKSLYNLGLSLYWQEKYDQAIATYQEALQYIDAENPDRWIILNSIGETYYWQEEYDQAIEAHKQALAIAANDRAKATSFTNLGQTQYWANNYAEAITYLEQGLEIAKDSSSRQKIIVLSTLGQVYFSSQQWIKAENTLEQCLELEREVNDPHKIISSLNLLIQVKLALEQPKSAKSLALEAVALAEYIQKPEESALALQNLGLIEAKLLNFDKAIETWERSLAVSREVQGTQLIEIPTLMSLGSLQEKQGNYIAAISCFEQSLRLAKQISENSVVKLSSKNLGQIYLSLGYFQVAIANFQQYLNLAQADGNSATDIDAYQKLGDAYHASGDFKQGINNYQTALNLAEQVDDLSQKIKALSNLVSGYRALQHYPQALEYAEKIVAISRSAISEEPIAIGQAQIELISLLTITNNLNVFDVCQEFLTLCQNTHAYPEHLALSCFGNAHNHFGNYSQAIDYFQRALSLLKLEQDRESTGEVLNSLGQVYLNDQDYDRAETTLKEAIALWESLRRELADRDELKIRLLTKQRKTYQLLQTALVGREKFIDALEIAELGRSRSLADILNQRSPNIMNSFSSNAGIQRAEIVRLARTLNATLVEYSETVQALYIWVIQPNGTICFEQIPMFNPLAVLAEKAAATYQSSELGQAIKDIRQAMNISEPLLRKLVPIDLPSDTSSRTKQTELGIALTKVYQFLIEPIKKYLPQNPNEKIIFIPQGYLYNVPFPALLDHSGNYLIEKHTVATAPSLKVLKLVSQIDRSDNNSLADTALIVGNPIMPELPQSKGYSLSDLPGADKEAIAIAKILKTSPLIGVDATKARVIEGMKTASTIHLATHGLLDYGLPEISFEQNILGAIALAPDNHSERSGDGLLTANEIISMSLQAELAVLSACHTGRGEITADGVIGLSRAFIMAGVPSVLVSLWAIPDSSTSILMENFYRQMQQGQDKAHALRQAMLMAIGDRLNPINWAAFTLIGL